MKIPGIFELGRISFRIGLSGESEIIVVREVVTFFEEIVFHIEQVVKNFIDLLVSLIVHECVL